jgi:hypothetical protein
VCIALAVVGSHSPREGPAPRRQTRSVLTLQKHLEP